MRPYFSPFPAGRAGAGLLLLRLLVASSAIGQASGYFGTAPTLPLWIWVLGSLNIACGLFLLAGFLTPFVSALFCLQVVFTEFSLLPPATPNVYGYTAPALYLILVAAALALLGPGALSVDARLFGMREIVISRKV